MDSKFKKVVSSLPVHVTPSIFFSRILRSEALVYNSFFFFLEQPLYKNYSISHTNTVISNAFHHLSSWRRKPWQGLFSQGRLLDRESLLERGVEYSFDSVEGAFIWKWVIYRKSFSFLSFSIYASKGLLYMVRHKPHKRSGYEKNRWGWLF